MPGLLSRQLWVACGLLILTNGPVFFVARRVLDQRMSWEEPFTRTVFATVALVAVGAVLLDRYRADGLRLGRPNLLAATAIVVFAAWMVTSSLWSLAPDLTRGRSMVYVGLAAFAWIVADLDDRAFRRALTIAVGVGVGASLLLVAFNESIGLDENGDWRGVFTNRNSLAPIAAVAILIGIGFVVETSGLVRLGVLALMGCPVVALYASGSRTPSLALAMAVGGASVVVAARVGGDRYGARLRAAVFGIGVLGAGAAAAIVSQLWDETTFAQRRTIWGHVRDRIAERPLHGFGWFNVWSDADFTSAHYLLTRGSAHGSFLEVWVGVGLFGLLPFLLIIGLALQGTIVDAWRKPSVASWTWLALVLFLVIENLTESFVLWYSYNWVLLMAAALRAGGLRRPEADRRTLSPSEPVTV